MALLELDHVSKFYDRGPHKHVALQDVSLQLDAGDRVAVYGERRSGRSTLLRIASGVEAPDSGVVRFAGRKLTDRGNDPLGDGIGYCLKTFPPTSGQFVLDQLMAGQLSRGISRSLAQSRVHAALARVGAERCAALEPNELNGTEATLVAIARVLVFQPKLLVVDEPTIGVDLLDRDGILSLLNSLADEGIAVLTSTRETTGLAGADRAPVLDNGVLRGNLVPQLATVTHLHPVERRSASS